MFLNIVLVFGAEMDSVHKKLKLIEMKWKRQNEKTNQIAFNLRIEHTKTYLKSFLARLLFYI